MMNNVVQIISSIQQKKNNYEYTEQALKDVIAEKVKLNKTLQTNIDLKQNYQNIIEATKLILERLTSESKIRLEQFVSYGLVQIFPDRAYGFKLILKEDTKKPGINMVLVENGIEQEITDAVGGGIVSTIGLLLQIYYLEVYGLNKIMFMDESLGAISKENEDDIESISYLNNVLHFLKYLSKNRGYKFVIVTHENKVKDLADSVYNIKMGEVEVYK